MKFVSIRFRHLRHLLRAAIYYLTPLRKDIIISYSERHFSPCFASGLELTSAGQLAKNVYEALLSVGHVLYLDNPLFRKSRLLFVSNPFNVTMRLIKADRVIFFPAVSHYGYTRKALLAAKGSVVMNGEEVHQLKCSDDIAKFQQLLDVADKVVLVGNEAVASTYVQNGVPENKIVTINYGVNADVFRPLPRNSSTITFICATSSMTLCKGIPFLLEAWRQLDERVGRGKARLVMAGHICGDVDLQHYRKGLDVQFWGPYHCGSKEHVELLNSAHYVVSPSLSEGQAGALLEAMSCGCVPVATRVSGIDADEYSGWVVAPGSVDDLADVLAGIVCDHGQHGWERRSEHVREFMLANHSWAHFRSDVASICKEYVGRSA